MGEKVFGDAGAGAIHNEKVRKKPAVDPAKIEAAKKAAAEKKAAAAAAAGAEKKEGDEQKSAEA